jgi:hypothetical protein
MKKMVIIALTFILAIPFLTGCEGLTQRSPQIKSGEFPFRFVYELNGEIHVVEDVIKYEFAGFSKFTDYKFMVIRRRQWQAYAISTEQNFHLGTVSVPLLIEENTHSELTPSRINLRSIVSINIGSAAYYMGDPNARGQRERGRPHLIYVEYICRTQFNTGFRPIERTVISHEQAYEFFGIRVIEWEFSEPIENRFR